MGEGGKKLEARDCGLTPAWRGILWVCQIESRAERLGLQVEAIGGKWRVWGNVLVAGDEDLMDRIEEFYEDK
jgi:hypothetical protein